VQYVITDKALYIKRGVLSRSVTQTNLETVQNSSFGQDITGLIFGYGSVTFEIGGGDDLSFRAIEDPRAIRALVDRTASNDDGLGGGDRQESVRASLPSPSSLSPAIFELRRRGVRPTRRLGTNN
jgi:hypothetical protein